MSKETPGKPGCEFDTVILNANSTFPNP